MSGNSDAATDGVDHATAIAALTKGQGHKYDHGHALVIAGGVGHGGAARLSARAALRVGAGLVTLGPPGSSLIEHAGPPDALMRRGVDDASGVIDLLRDARIDALCLGPGCGIKRAADLLPVVLDAGLTTLLDADALSALSRAGFDGLHELCVLTPHEGEFRRLFPDLGDGLARIEQDDRIARVRDASLRTGATVLLKGPLTIIAHPDGRVRRHSAFDVPWLAAAGSGDVLAGIITGLLARGLPPLDAAATGAWLHAAAARRFGPGLIADDLPEQIPALFRDLGL
ncbi:NAD(P)H-hydrate dehydratase [Paracoccus sp. TK19116]|uniref:ADP-dependent (S)-NAD(P)H-hydrate dehydratase n=1 Tax=Paracoccus albicereus TaxID=2922394 RepID=A0ABT1MSE0_9RHOB|nr:NAD(P)H-hydrate dehydratase [Paracoccus albicereus]MCQ0971218.1 NAD(P)H-hydrate dehydratase [Paracoccus albicereus]